MAKYNKKKCLTTCLFRKENKQILLHTCPYTTMSTVEEVELYIFTTDLLPGIEFGVYKQNGFCDIHETRTGLKANFNALKHSSIKGAIKDFETSLQNCNYIGESMVNFIQNKPDLKNQIKNEIEFFELVDEFEKITKLTLPISSFFGVDVVKLDRLVKTPDGTSLSQQLVNKYGQRASDIVKELISKNWW